MAIEWATNGTPGERRPELSRGTTQSGVRLYNERLILSLVRLHGRLPKAEMARLTGLSAQTVSVIVRQLEADGLLKRRTPQRGKVGQPLVPFELDPDGAFSIGLKVGRRSGDLMLLDLAGNVRHTIHRPYNFPSPGELIAFVTSGVDELVSTLGVRQRERISGLGIAAPFELWNWAEDVGAPPDVLTAWKDFDLQAELAQLFGWPIHFCNDASAACAAELLFGLGRDLPDFAYFYLGYFIGGGIVLNGSLYLGKHGNAGALASFPVTSADGRSQQLVHSTSLAALERDILREGGDPEFLWRDPGEWRGAGQALERWLSRAALEVATAAAGAMAVLDCSAVVIDGAVPLAVRSRFTRAVQDALHGVDRQGLADFPVLEGTIGADARALGAASLPLFDNFIINRNVLFKEKT
ncbi:ROK family transcriptional regulator [Aestuariivirga sp.]|uniref:ROK family transcriptional regulator n=1 Tax=Aestuariivirga sp. TaxID=2650926 RepID=UPI003BAA0057